MKPFITTLTIALFFSQLVATPFYAQESMPWGVDSELSEMQKRGGARPVKGVGQRVGITLIRFFQKKISPIDGPRSSFYPTSSQYALEAIREWGFLSGVALGCDRLMRENGESWVYPTIIKFNTPRKYDPVKLRK